MDRYQGNLQITDRRSLDSAASLEASVPVARESNREVPIQEGLVVEDPESVDARLGTSA